MQILAQNGQKKIHLMIICLQIRAILRLKIYLKHEKGAIHKK